MRNRDDLAQLRQHFLGFRLERALSRLARPVSFLNTGAHPDDEHSALLAWLRFGRGLSIATLSSTRGQGGQNRIGPERGQLLGLMRSREMEHAAEVLDADHHWLDRGPGDPLHDFGFSKSGEDTLRRWDGKAAVVERMVQIYRRHRPDIILPTFLDVPGQHGHHRAMTAAALEAVPLAADPAYQTAGLPVWQVAKAYLPAWSGGGATYDDEVPPPPATLTLTATTAEPLTGASWTQIGEASRLCHATQDMGDPLYDAPKIWPLHLVGGAAEGDILDGLPQGFADLDHTAKELAVLDRIFADLTDLRGPALVGALVTADRQLEQAMVAPQLMDRHGHRLQRTKAALHHAILLADGALPARLSAQPGSFRSGETMVIDSQPVLAPDVTLTLTTPEGFAAEGMAVHALPGARPPPAFHQQWHRLGGNGAFHAMIGRVIEGRPFAAAMDLQSEPRFLPAALLDWTPAPLIHRRGGRAGLWPLTLPEGATIDLPEGLALVENTLRADDRLAPGAHRLVLCRDGQPALASRRGRLITGEMVEFLEPLTLDLLSLDLGLPGGRIGYLPGTEDIFAHLQATGLAVERLEALPAAGDLTAYDTLLLGVVAFGSHPGIAAALPDLCHWLRAGGNLVTFYQRPDQGWPQAGIGLDLLRIGLPSLRWRVTDPAAEVTVLDPESPLLTRPNAITAQDWQGWDKERGLYFAAEWAEAYQPLVAMHDPGEAPLYGALVSGDFGAGRHSHVSLTLHHQIGQMVPGAFRLLANLLQPRRDRGA